MAHEQVSPDTLAPGVLETTETVAKPLFDTKPEPDAPEAVELPLPETDTTEGEGVALCDFDQVVEPLRTVVNVIVRVGTMNVAVLLLVEEGVCVFIALKLKLLKPVFVMEEDPVEDDDILGLLLWLRDAASVLETGPDFVVLIDAVEVLDCVIEREARVEAVEVLDCDIETVPVGEFGNDLVPPPESV